MKKILLIIAIILGLSATTNAQYRVFDSGQVGTSPVTNYYLKTDGKNSFWAAVSGGGSGGVSAFSTSTAWGSILNIFPNNITDLFSIGYTGSGVATSSNAEFVVDPTAKLALFLNNTKVGIGTTSPYAALSVVGQTVGSWFTSTSTTQTNTFPLANITKLSNLTSNGFVKTSGGDGTLSVDTTTYESGLTAGDGLTRTANDFDCDTADGSTFGCLSSSDWTTFNNKGSGTVTSVSVASSNGLAGSSSGGATPTLTLSTSITGVLKGNGTAISAAANGTDYTLLTSTTCGAGAHISAVTAAGAVTCSSDSGGSGGGTGVGWLWNSINSLYQSTTTDDVLLGAVSTTSTAKLEVIAGGTKPAAYFSGNVGIGTTSPYSKLAVEGTTGLTVKYTGVNTPGFFYTNSGGSVTMSSNVDWSNTVQDSSKYQWAATASQVSDSYAIYRSPAGATWSPVSMLYIDNMGDVGLGTTSPYAKLSVVGQAVAAYFTATTSTASTFPYASTTALTVSGGLYNTSLSDGCLNITSGLIGSTGSACGVGGGGVSGGTAGMLASWTNSTTLTATGTPTAASYVATSSTATSTFAGGLNVQGQVGIGTSSPVAGPALVMNAGSSIYCPQVILATSTSMTISMDAGCHVLLRMGTSNATITLTGGYPGSIQTQTLCNPNAFGGAVTYTNVLYGTDATAVSNSTTTNVCTRNIIEKTAATSTDIYRVIGQQIIK